MANALAKQRKAARVKQDEGVLHETGIRALRRKPVFHTPNVFPPEGFEPKDVHAAVTEGADDEAKTSTELQHCYVCKQKYSVIHLFYDQLCPACAKLNFAKRTERADLRGRVALLTGGRVKIGYQAGIKLLRSGAHLIVTTRFPRDSAKRYAAEPDFADWATGSRSSASICATRRAWRPSAASCSPAASGWISSSTTPARRCAARPTSTAT